MKENLEKQLLHGSMILCQAIKIVALFFHLKHFWAVYLCYVMLFLKGFFRSSIMDPNFIHFDIETRLYTFIDGFSWTSCMALIIWLYVIYQTYCACKQSKKRIFLLGVVHIFLIVLVAGSIAEFGERMAWVLKSK